LHLGGEFIFSMYSLQNASYNSQPEPDYHANICIAFTSVSGSVSFSQFGQFATRPTSINISPIFHEFGGNTEPMMQSPGGWSSWFNTHPPNISCCTWIRKRAFLVPVVILGNLWHTLWHTIPAHEEYRRLSLHKLAASQLDVLALPAQPLSAYNTLNSVGWQLFLESIGFSMSEIGHQLVGQAALLQKLNHFFCYAKLDLVGHNKFSLAYIDHESSHPLIDQFRLDVHRQFRIHFRSVTPVDRRVRFVLRKMHGRRVWNEQELTTALAHMTDFVVFEHLPFHEQLVHVLSSIGLCGVHGAGLAWVVLLQQERGFLIEIVPSAYITPTKAAYSILAQASHLGYKQFQEPCLNSRCDVFVNLTSMEAAIRSFTENANT